MSESSSNTRVIGAIIAIVCACCFGWYKWSALHPKGIDNQAGRKGPGGPGPGAKPGQGQSGKPGGGPPPMMADLNLTAEQTKQLEEIRKTSGNDFKKMREHTDKVLTPEQRTKMREQGEKRRAEMDARRAEMDASLKRALSEQDFAAFKKRMEQMRPPGPPPGGGPPGGGAPPDGGPPPGGGDAPPPSG